MHVEYSDCGFFYGSYPLVLYSEAHDWLNEGYSADQVPESLWGKMKDGVITFDEGTADNNLLAAKILTSPAAIWLATESGSNFMMSLDAIISSDEQITK